MSYPVTVRLPDGTTAESDLEAIVAQLADQVGTLTREVTTLRELAGARTYSGDASNTGFYL